MNKTTRQKVFSRALEMSNSYDWENISSEYRERLINKAIDDMENVWWLQDKVNRRTKKLHEYEEIEKRALARCLGLNEFYFFTKEHYRIMHECF